MITVRAQGPLAVPVLARKIIRREYPSKEGKIMNTRKPFTVTLIAPAGISPDTMHTYDTTVHAGSLVDAHTVSLGIMEGHNAQNAGFWHGWCYEIKEK